MCELVVGNHSKNNGKDFRARESDDAILLVLQILLLIVIFKTSMNENGSWEETTLCWWSTGDSWFPHLTSALLTIYGFYGNVFTEMTVHLSSQNYFTWDFTSRITSVVKIQDPVYQWWTCHQFIFSFLLKMNSLGFSLHRCIYRGDSGSRFQIWTNEFSFSAFL